MAANDLLRRTVDDLCSDACAGRRPGTAAGRAAQACVAESMRLLGLEPAGEVGEVALGDRRPTGGSTGWADYLQPIRAISGANVLGLLRGAGPRAGRTIILAAHHDVWCDPAQPEAYRGADDNAAAVAILLACAEQLVARRAELDRSVLFCVFDAEEPPYFLGESMGSMHFVRQPTIPLESVDMMVCLDLVGHAVGSPGLPEEVRQSVFALGAELSAGTGPLVDRIPAVPGIAVRRIDNDCIPPLSDYHAFDLAGVPFLFFSAGRWQHYHRATDTPEKLDFEKMGALATYLAGLVVALGARSEDRATFMRGSHDDQATVSSLLALLALLEPFVAGLSHALAELQRLGASLAVGTALTAGQRASLGATVAALERGLAG